MLPEICPSATSDALWKEQHQHINEHLQPHAKGLTSKQLMKKLNEDRCSGMEQLVFYAYVPVIFDDTLINQRISCCCYSHVNNIALLFPHFKHVGYVVARATRAFLDMYEEPCNWEDPIVTPQHMKHVVADYKHKGISKLNADGSMQLQMKTLKVDNPMKYTMYYCAYKSTLLSGVRTQEYVTQNANTQ